MTVVVCFLPEFHPEFFPDEDKKNYHCLQQQQQQQQHAQHTPEHRIHHQHNHQQQIGPDLTRTATMVVPLSIPSCYEYPYCDQSSKYGHIGGGRTCSEHHYDVPHINTGESPSSPSVSSVPTDAQATSKSSESNRSLSSFTCSCK